MAKQINRGIILKKTGTKTYELPEYLPDITKYVYCTRTDSWQSKEVVIANRYDLYLKDKGVVVNRSIYELMNNVETKEEDIIDLSQLLIKMPLDVLKHIIKFVISRSINMYYRMCLVSKRIKQLTVVSADYRSYMRITQIGRMRNVSLVKYNTDVVDGILMSSHFTINAVLDNQNVYDRLLVLLEGTTVNSTIVGHVFTILQWVDIRSFPEEDVIKIKTILSKISIKEEERVEVRKFLKYNNLKELI